MKQKLGLILIITLFLIAFSGFATATSDLGITSIQTDSAIYRGQTYVANVTIHNYGPDDFASSEFIYLDNGNGTTTNTTIQTLTNTSDVEKHVTFQYLDLGTFTLEANVSIPSTIDANQINNIAQKPVTVLNHVPTLSNPGTLNLVVGNELLYDVSSLASDDDVPTFDTLTYSLISGPSGMIINATTGQISGWTPSTYGTEAFTVEVSDGHDAASELFYVSVQADQPRIEFTNSELVIGNANTAREDVVHAIAEIKNTGTQVLSNIQPKLLDSHGNEIIGNPLIGSLVVNPGTTLNPGDTATIEFDFQIPDNVNSKQTEFGTLHVEATAPSGAVVEDSLNTYTEAESFLDIDDCDIIINGDSESCSGTIDVKEGDDIELKVNVENLYSSDDINNVRVSIFDDNGWNIDTESDSSYDLNGGDEQTITIHFTLDNELDEDNTQLTIEVYGKDEAEHFKHYATDSFDLNVDREDDDVRIDQLDLLSNPIYNNDQFVDLEVTIRNAGYDDENHAKIRVVCPALSIDTVKEDINIDSLQTITKRIQLEVPLHSNASDYVLEVYSYYDDSHVSDSEQVTLTVLESGESSSTSQTNNSTNIGVNTNEGNNNNGVVLVQPIPEPTYGTSTKVKDNPWMVALLIVVLLLVLGGIAYLSSELIAMEKAKARRKNQAKAGKKSTTKATSKKTTTKTTSKKNTSRKTATKKATSKKTATKKASGKTYKSPRKAKK